MDTHQHVACKDVACNAGARTPHCAECGGWMDADAIGRPSRHAGPSDAPTVTTVRQWPLGMYVGCKRDALAAYNGSLKYLSEGAVRRTYVNAAHTVVYKVAKARSVENARRANESEYNRMVSMARNGARAISTPCALFYIGESVIIAMLYRPGHSNSLSNGQYRKMRRLLDDYAMRTGDRIGDMHGENFRATPAGRAVVTDCGDVVW